MTRSISAKWSQHNSFFSKWISYEEYRAYWQLCQRHEILKKKCTVSSPYFWRGRWLGKVKGYSTSNVVFPRVMLLLVDGWCVGAIWLLNGEVNEEGTSGKPRGCHISHPKELAMELYQNFMAGQGVEPGTYSEKNLRYTIAPTLRFLIVIGFNTYFKFDMVTDWGQERQPSHVKTQVVTTQLSIQQLHKL